MSEIRFTITTNLTEQKRKANVEGDLMLSTAVEQLMKEFDLLPNNAPKERMVKVIQLRKVQEEQNMDQLLEIAEEELASVSMNKSGILSEIEAILARLQD